jgi:hypothetical protein
MTARPIFGTSAVAFMMAFFVAFMANGCGTVANQVRTYPAPSSDELMAALKVHQRDVRGINAETRATSWLGGERVRGTVQILASRTGDLRFEAEVTLQGTVAALAVTNSQFTFLDHQKHIFREGPACPANVASLIRIPLAPAAVAAILLGDAPVHDRTKVLAVEWDSAHAADVLVLGDPSGARLWVGLHRPNAAVAAWDVVFLDGAAQASEQRWRVSYEDLARQNGVALPRVVKFAEPGKGFDDGVEIRFRDRQVNGTFAENAFVLQRPPGYTVEVAPCGAATHP